MEIQVLSSEIVDQIAAGEVVERPAHMVKELVENAVDAGATQVDVEFDHGGRFVKVKDDGQGMGARDLELCLSRHATSKIKKASDLWGLHSFGFRGEALSSIAAVSRLEIVTKTKPAKSGSKIISEFGKQTAVVDVASEKGTTITIKDLFENTPARLKFLKSDGAEGTQIKNVLKAIALSHPEIQIRVRNKGKLLYFWNKKESLLERAKEVLEEKKLYAGDFEYDGFRAKVILGGPNNTVGNSRQIWSFVQNRWVQDKSLQAALMDAYRSLLMHGEFPIAVVKLQSPVDEVDVNIHPTKSQVKFVNPSSAFRAVNRAARSVLEQAPWLEDMLPQKSFFGLKAKTSVDPEGALNIEQQSGFDAPEVQRVQYSQKSHFDNLNLNANSRNYEKFIPEAPKVGLKDLQKAADHSFVRKVEGFKTNLQEEEVLAAENVKTNVDPTSFKVTPQSKGYKWENLQVLGQANLTYILTQSDKGMVIVDQHAAHERVLYEKFFAAWENGGLEIQSYLIPLTIDLEEEHVDALSNYVEDFKKFGVEFEQMGPQTIVVNAAPQILKEKALTAVLEKTSREVIERGGSFAFDKIMSDLCATMACHSAIRAGQALSHEEMKSLLLQMDEYPMSSFCPHGRPVFIEYTFYEIEKDFCRIV